MRPSILSQAFSGFLLLVVMIYFFYIRKTLAPKDLLQIGLLFAIAFGIHGLSHSSEEIFYGYNPLTTGEWWPSNKLIERK